MNYFVAFVTLLLALNESACAQEFPSITTEKLSGETIKVPESFKGYYTIIGVGTSKKAEDELRTWQAPIYNKFIAKTGLMDDMYNVKVCFLPLFTGVAKAGKNKVVKKLRENNESVVYDHLYIYSGSREPFDNLGLKDKSTPYFYLLDKSGVVIWKGEGRFRQAYFDEIEEKLMQ